MTRSDFTVIQDVQEKLNWDFTFHNFNQVRQKLKTGDYTLKEFKDDLCIERKRNTGEIAMNFGSKQKQFIAELDRMKTFKYKYLILEFSEDMLSRFPLDSGIPAKFLPSIRINANYLISCINRLQDRDITVIFANNRDEAINEALEIFDKVIRENGRPDIIF